MKRFFILSALILLITSSAFAQDVDINRPQITAPVAGEAIQKGNWLVGASIANIGHNFGSKTFSLDINPRAGYFVSDNAVLGSQAQFGVSLYKGGQDWRYGLTPFARYYFPEGAAPTHRYFAEAVLGFAGSSQEASDGDAIFSSVYGLSAGYAHFVASHVALEAMLNLIRSNANIDVGDSSTGLSLSLGLQIYLPGRGSR